MYHATIIAPLKPALAKKLFSAESSDIQGRASYTLEDAGSNTRFVIEAADSTALRTALSSITKLLSVIEKTRDIK